MPRINAATAGGRNALAFLDTLAISDHTLIGLVNSDDGYTVIVGGTPQCPRLFTSYRDHPRILVTIRDKTGAPGIINGTPLQSAAGRYQRLARYYDAYRPQPGLRDFSPHRQDLIALRQIKEQGAMPDVAAGRIASAFGKRRDIRASLPGVGYGQYENTLDSLLAAYVRAGGVMTS